MAIRDIVVRGYGNGTFSPGIVAVVSRGYTLPGHAEATDSNLSLISDTKAAATINSLLQVVARHREQGFNSVADAWLNVLSALEREDDESLFTLRIKYGLKLDELEAAVTALEARADALENP